MAFPEYLANMRIEVIAPTNQAVVPGPLGNVDCFCGAETGGEGRWVGDKNPPLPSRVVKVKN